MCFNSLKSKNSKLMQFQKRPCLQEKIYMQYSNQFLIIGHLTCDPQSGYVKRDHGTQLLRGHGNLDVDVGILSIVT